MPLVKVKYDYYMRIRSKVEDLIGNQTRSIQKYQQEYEQELNRSQWEIGRKQELFKQMDKSQIVYIGDFHAQAQSTRAVLRIARKLGAQNVCLGLECFFIEHQKVLNAYLSGHLNEREFLKKIEWKKTWGFPWEFTRPLMKWASQNKVPIVALNSMTKRKFADQDRFTAGLINTAIKTNSTRKMLVQFGDFHLASKHLPQEVRKVNRKLSEVVLLQSPENLYFKLLKKHKDPSSADFVKLSANRWALMSVLPWVKWQDYLLYLETGHDKKIKVDDYDLTDHVSQAVEVLNKMLNIHIKVDDLSVYSVNDEVLFNKIQKLPALERAYYKELLLSGQSFYCPEQQMGFVARPSLNQISKVAALFVLYKLGVYKKSIIDGKKDFLKNIWLEMLTYFLTKIINPKKKTDTFDDIRTALRSEQFSDKGKEALVLALEQKLNEVRFATFQDLSFLNKKKSSLRNKKSHVTAANILGGIMGEKVYTAFQKKILKLPQHKQLLLKDLQGKLFVQSYYETVEIIDSWPSAFKSKFDKF